MNQPHNRSYEYKTIALLAFGFFLLNLDRWVIAPLFPVMQKDLGFNYQDLGMIIGSTALTWGLASLFMGSLSDKIGRRKLLLPSLLFLSFFSGITGLAGGLMSMLLLRAVLGIFEGAYVPTAFATVKDVSNPSRTGMNMGILAFGAAMGIGLAPIIATQLLPVVPSWQWVFILVSIPGLITTYLLYKTVKDPAYTTSSNTQVLSSLKDVLKYRNILLGIPAMCGVMSCIFVLSGMLPTYLTDHLKLDMQQMGFIAAAPGLGGAAGALIVPGLSDKFGRKPVILTVIVIAAILVFIIKGVGADQQMLLFALLFAACAMGTGCLTMLDGPIATETVPPAMIGAATGIIIGAGEIFGGGFAPVISGIVAEKFGIASILNVAFWGLVVTFICALFLKETAPAIVGKREN